MNCGFLKSVGIGNKKGPFPAHSIQSYLLTARIIRALVVKISRKALAFALTFIAAFIISIGVTIKHLPIFITDFVQ